MTKAAELAKMGEVLTNSQIGGRRNIIINGAMQVAQRATSATSTGYGSVDRIRINTANTDELAFTQSQSTTTPGQGFSNSFKFEVTTKEDALADDEFANIQYRIEAQDLQSLAFGTSDAKKITLSFWVRSSLAGKYSVLFYLVDDVRSNTQSFTISSADTWEHKTITIDGDTTGVIDNDNGAGLNISFVLAAGADYAGTPHSDWGAYSATDDFAFSDQVNFIAQTGTFYLTGLQVEIGSQATPFEHRSFGEELALCQRYCVQIVNTENVSAHIILAGMSRGSTNKNFTLPLPVTMRNTTPSVTLTGEVRLLNPEAHDYANSTANTLTCGGITPTLVYMGNMLGLLYTGSVTGVTDTTNADYNLQIVSASDHLFIIDSEL